LQTSKINAREAKSMRLTLTTIQLLIFCPQTWQLNNQHTLWCYRAKSRVPYTSVCRNIILCREDITRTLKTNHARL